MDVEFCNLTYSVQKRFYGEKKTILKSLSGKFLSGHLTVILGSSGAGKTSLLHVLSGYKTSGIAGQLFVNDQIRDEAWFRRRSCYITQEDRLPAFMTVDEAMKMVARLKLGDQKTGALIINEILMYLGLENVRDVKTERLSGGQQKRLSIALELVSNPPVFFLDEPTSGLDDVSAKNTIRLLRRLAEEGRTVVCTMHQPSASMLRLFHKVYVVAKGLCVFQGAPNTIVPFLAKHGYECPTSYNPSDYIIELIDNDTTINNLSIAIENGKTSEDYFDPTIMSLDTKSEEVISTDIVIETKKTDLILIDSSWIKLKDEYAEGNASYAISSWMQFWILFQRFFAQGIRNKKALIVQALYYLGTGLLFGSAYYNNGNNGNMMFNHLKFYVGVIVFASFSRLFIPIILFPGEIRATKKEHFNRWYSIIPYYMATMLATIPFQFFFNICFMTIIYYLVGLSTELWRYIMYNVCLILIAFSTEGVGFAIGATFNEQNGSVVGPAVAAPLVGLAIYGFDFAKHIPLFMQIIMRLSPMRCGLAAFVIITFGFDRKPLNCDQIYCHFSDPKTLILFLDGTNEQIYTELAALVTSIIVFRFLAYLSLRKRFAT